MNIVARICAFALAMALVACGGGGGGGGTGVTPNPPAAVVGRTESLVVNSTNTGAAYSIDVYLPPQYDAAAQPHLPVIFAVDGDARFGYPGNGTRFQAFMEAMQQRQTPAILIGVGGTARRNNDFLPPGASSYHSFLSQELVPAIDQRYRTDPAMRVLSGLSYGGTITFLVFAYEGESPSFTFRQFWSTEANGLAGQLISEDGQLAVAAQGKSLPVTLFLAGGGVNTNGPFVSQLYQAVLSHNYAGLLLQQASYATDHVGTDLPAFNEALTRFIH